MLNKSVLTLIAFALLFVFSGCGPRVSDFEGTWRGEMRYTDISPNGQEASSSTDNFELDISEGGSADLIIELFDNCSLPANLTTGGEFEVEETTCDLIFGNDVYPTEISGDGNLNDDQLEFEVGGPSTGPNGGDAGGVRYEFEGERL